MTKSQQIAERKALEEAHRQRPELAGEVSSLIALLKAM